MGFPPPPPPLLVAMLALGLVLGMGRSDHVAVAAIEGGLTNCTRSCGGRQVPYPFGLDDDSEDCYFNYDAGTFALACNNSYSPPKLFQGAFEVLDIILPLGQMRVLMDISYDCYNSTFDAGLSTWGVTLTNMLMLSYKENVFTAVGCETEAKFSIGQNKFGGCMTGCNSLAGIEDGQCLGIGCCQSQIPPGVNLYNTSFIYRDRNSTTYRFNNCSYSFVVEKNNYTFRKSDLTYMDQSRSFPMILDWFIGDQSCEEAMNGTSYACVSSDSECLNSANGPGYICNCSRGYQGNPYENNGCQDIDECQLDRTQYPCFGICTNTKGDYICTCPEGSYSSDPKKERCVTIERRRIPRALVFATAIVGIVLLIVVMVLLICLQYQTRKNQELRKKFFEENGGVYLQKALLANHISSFKIFEEEALEKATKNFDKDFIIGHGGSGKVYKGILEDKSIVAIKRFKSSNQKDGQDFANEISILSKINHVNIVKLLGCCLESKIPMLVYEYISGGTLFNYLHSKWQQKPISFHVRLQLAVEIARAFKYLHTDASPPIYHGDVKSANVLLDEHVAKVSDFGTSMLAPKDSSQFKTMVQGTQGYLDPEYLLTGHLTDKSDVFSYGVILAELLTRKMAIDKERNGMGMNLSHKFVSSANEDKIEEILDPEIMSEGSSDKIRKLVKITLQCLNIQGKHRPTMKEVVEELEECAARNKHPWEQYYPQEADNLLGESSTSAHNAGTTSHVIFEIQGLR